MLIECDTICLGDLTNKLIFRKEIPATHSFLVCLVLNIVYPQPTRGLKPTGTAIYYYYASIVTPPNLVVWKTKNRERGLTRKGRRKEKTVVATSPSIPET